MVKKLTYQISVPVTILRERNRFIAYTPALDLSTSGKTLQEARRRFEEALDLFIEELVEEGTLETVLRDCGWEKLSSQWKPPMIIGQQLETISIPA